ncbi:MAG: hypothetical protein Fur0018_24930 [Anaerolineales bacterium]
MNKTVRNTLIVLVVFVGAVALVGTGFVFGQRMAWLNGYGGMMGGGYGNMMGDGYGGMMGGGYGNMMGGGYGNMMGGGYGADVPPLTVDEARAAVEDYLAAVDNTGLTIKEIMVFDNNAYAIVAEQSSGVGAFELLVDPVTKAVFPEYGPNMMWNLKYGMHAAGDSADMMGGYGGMMGSDYGTQNTPQVSAEMPVSPAEALETAQRFLDQYAPGTQVSEDITAFYGYYTIDTEKDGQTVGMLSVNGFTRQVFPHTWHGEFIEMSEE